MGFWGWLFLLGAFGVIFLRARISTWLQERTAAQVKSLLTLSVAWTLVSVVMIMIYSAIVDAGPASVPWFWQASTALSIWGIVLGLIESGRRQTQSVDDQRNALFKRSGDAKRLFTSQSPTKSQPQASRHNLTPQQQTGTRQVPLDSRAPSAPQSASPPPMRHLPPLVAPRLTPQEHEHGQRETAQHEPAVDVGRQLFGPQWRKLIEQTGAGKAEEQSLIRLLTEGPPPPPHAKIEHPAATVPAPLPAHQIGEPPAVPPPAPVAQAPQPAHIIPAAAPPAPYVAAAAPVAPQPSAAHAAASMPPTPAVPVPAGKPATASTAAQQAPGAAAARPGPVAAPGGQRGLPSRPAGPVSLGLAGGPRPVGPVTLAGASGPRPVGPVKLLRGATLAGSASFGSGLTHRLGVQADDAAGTERFSYQPKVVVSRLSGAKPAPAQPEK